MASTVPAKSQPLHNFSLPRLKWTKNHTNNHQRGRRLADSSSHQSPPPDSAQRQSPLLNSAPRQSPMRESASESESGYASPSNNGSASENPKNQAPESSKHGFSITYSDHMIPSSEKRSTISDGYGGVKEARSKLSIRFRTKNKLDDVQDEGKASTVGEVEELAAKTWNLRPRRPIQKQPNVNGGTSKVGGASSPENKAQLPPATTNRQESIWLRSGPEANFEERREKKRKFSIPLSREEIEEDIFAMTGSKPARRPRKRVKAVQKQLDNAFPGLWLASITPDSYKVSEAPIKG
ncbi:uncharacterized protein LOC132299172 [Cornus florida]|uniref:uncharacterized protein LOC132299172 n=1 Tax=Cornus florida TaxID=4283 RepID=UPI00289F3462|nr:uncharacterized protein LOC132299172 [Cornus florida]